ARLRRAETREEGEDIGRRHVYRDDGSNAMVACGSAVDIAALVAPRRYGYVRNRVHNLAVLLLFAGFSRSGRLWIALVAARCGLFLSESGRRLLAMDDGVWTETSSTGTPVVLRAG